MTLAEIKAAVSRGEWVYWSNPGYHVFRDNIGQWLICYMPNGYCVGLTHADGVTLSGDESDFHIYR